MLKIIILAGIQAQGNHPFKPVLRVSSTPRCIIELHAACYTKANNERLRHGREVVKNFSIWHFLLKNFYVPAHIEISNSDCHLHIT